MKSILSCHGAGGCISLLAAVGAFAAAGADGGPIVRNGGFDDARDGKTVGWNAVGEKYVYRDGAGRSGTRALCYENDDPRFYSFPGQRIELKAGRSYEYEVWVKTENLQGDESGATVCIEWNGENGKWLGGAYVEGVKGTKDWTLVRGRTPPIPANAATFRVSPYVRKGMRGKAWFDDLAVKEFHPAPLSGLFSTAYRNVGVLEDGSVTFKAVVNPAEVEYHGGATVWFRYRDAAGAVCRRKGTNAAGDELTLPLAGLKGGEQEVAAELETAGGKVVGAKKVKFTRVDSRPAEWKTWFDRHGRTIVDGKPFFPLGMYWHSIVSNRIDVYAQGPFNCLMPYGSPDRRELLDYCHEKGLKVIYSVKDVYSGTRWAPKGIDTEADELAFISDRVARFKDHPAMLAWYLNDEMPLTMLDRLTARRDLMERLDPGRPGWVVLYQYGQIAEYMPTFDVIGTDPYPIPERPACVATTWTRATACGALGCKPLWQVPQAFNWGCYRKDPAERAKMRAPTEAELRSMCWQCIANGANGLVLYSFFDLSKPTAGVPFEQRWGECCRVGREIRDCFPILLSEPCETPVTAKHRAVRSESDDSDDMVSCRAWRKDGRTYVLVVNGYGEALDVELDGIGRAAAASPVFGPKPKVEAGRVALSLAALEPALVEIAR